MEARMRNWESNETDKKRGIVVKTMTEKLSRDLPEQMLWILLPCMTSVRSELDQFFMGDVRTKCILFFFI